MDLFADLVRANMPTGTIDGISFGLVANVTDPLKLQRLQVYDMTKGGQHTSDWLFRLLPYTSYSPPVPQLNDLVVVGYIDGNPHKGCYLGVVVNNKNKPVGSDSDLTLILGNAKIELLIDGTMIATGLKSATVEARERVSVRAGTEAVLEAPQVTVKATNSATIEAPQLALKASGQLTLESATIALQTTNAKVAGKDITAVGGRDSRGDTIVDKGY